MNLGRERRRGRSDRDGSEWGARESGSTDGREYQEVSGEVLRCFRPRSFMSRLGT